MQVSKHALIRMDQRAIPPLVVQWLMDYGSTRYDKHGARVRFFDKRSRKRLAQQIGERMVGQLSKQLSTYLVTDGSTVITVGHRTKRISR